MKIEGALRIEKAAILTRLIGKFVRFAGNNLKSSRRRSAGAVELSPCASSFTVGDVIVDMVTHFKAEVTSDRACCRGVGVNVA